LFEHLLSDGLATHFSFGAGHETAFHPQMPQIPADTENQ
jgi:hypothetical protein